MGRRTSPSRCMALGTFLVFLRWVVVPKTRACELRRLPEKNHFGIFASTRRSPSPARAFLFIRRWPRFISLRAWTWDCKLPKPAAARPENLVSTKVSVPSTGAPRELASMVETT